jgi:hypothetical protein
VLAALPAAYTNQGLNLPSVALGPIRGSGLGFYSFLYRYLYGPDLVAVRLARMEHLRSEVPKLLESVGEPITPELRDYIGTAPSLNTSEHEPHQQLYDAELAGLVAERDALVTERHGYEFSSP